MKRFIIILILLINSFSFSWSQQDTLSFSEIDSVFTELDTSIFHGYLLDRSTMESEIISAQLYDDYSQVQNTMTFLNALSVVNTSKVFSNTEETTTSIAQSILDYFEEKEDDLSNRNDEIPLGIGIYDMYWIDSNAYSDGKIDIQNKKIIPLANDESEIYKNKRVVLASPINFNNKVTPGQELVIDERFIFTGDNVEINLLQIDFGDGLTKIKDGQSIPYPTFEGDRDVMLTIDYNIDTVTYLDTVVFEILNQPNDSLNYLAKADEEFHPCLLYGSQSDKVFTEQEDITFNVNILPRCNYESTQNLIYDGKVLPRIKRPVIIITPYYPNAQPENAVTTVSLFSQFNTWGVFEELSERGYDVIIVENTDTHKSVARCGRDFARLLWKINDWKKLSYPQEDWENTIIGYSMGGQVAKYALKWMEYKHMVEGNDHHHTRLYISYDSPHHGGKIPMGCQAVYFSHNHTGSLIASIGYLSLVDDGSSSMVEPHIQPNIPNFSSSIVENEIYNADGRTDIREDLLEELEVDFQHPKSYTSDERITFPAFTRNIGVTMGSFSKDYTDEYVLTAGQKYTEHYSGLKNSILYASSYGGARPSYTRFDLWTFNFLTAAVHEKYQTFDIAEWDLAKGGHKSVFYNNWESGWIPTGALQILQFNNPIHNLHYEGETSFMALVSGLSIKPSLWANNNIDYDLQGEGLMFMYRDQTTPNQDESNFYGYPNVGKPIEHFDITPFEAIYADEITYEHIKPNETIGALSNNNPSGINYGEYLDSLKMFIVREVENENVYLQNYKLGWNHNNWTTLSEYKAWYKADKKLELGEDITPKTDIGKYIVTNHGNLTVYAGEQVVMSPGFEAHYGSKYHAYIEKYECLTPQCEFESKSGSQNDMIDQNKETNKELALEEDSELQNNTEYELKAFPNPNNGSFTVLVPEASNCSLMMTDLSGREVYYKSTNQKRVIISEDLSPGVYLVTCYSGNKKYQTKIIVQ